MSDSAVAKIRRHGDFTIPSEMRAKLDLKPGDYVSMLPFPGGMVVSKLDTGDTADRARAFEALVSRIGLAAEARGITEDEDLDALIEEAQEHAYKERYGG